MSTPFVFVHRVRLDEVDAAGIVYFPRYFGWCHEAMAALLDAVEGGYPGLLIRRRVGFPTVHAEADYVSPLRFGDHAHITVTVERIGSSSCSFRFDITRAPDGSAVAAVRHVVAFSGVEPMQSRPIPDDIRTILERYRATTP